MVVVVVGVIPGVAPGVVVVSVMGVPFLSPATTALASAPRKELKSALSLSTTLPSPSVPVILSIRAASVVRESLAPV